MRGHNAEWAERAVREAVSLRMAGEYVALGPHETGSKTSLEQRAGPTVETVDVPDIAQADPVHRRPRRCRTVAGARGWSSARMLFTRSSQGTS